MTTLVFRASAILIFCTLILASALPLVARSQSIPGDEIIETDANNTDIVENEVQDPIPYELEGLLGDKVIGDFVLGPGKVELEINPGESKTVEITVSNRIGREQDFIFEIEDMTGSSDGSQAVVLLGDDRGPYTLKDYISIPSMSFDLDHNLRARVPVTITIPEDAEPGGRYGSVLVSTVLKRATRGDAESTTPTSAIVSRIGTLFFITIPGEANTEGELKDFSTVPEQKLFQSGPINFQILYENTGSIHLNPYGELRISNILGEEVGTVDLEPWFAMPNSLRFREVTWNREVLFGRYTATVHINRGYDDIIDTRSYTFWVLPWKYVAGGVAILFVVIFFIRLFFKKFEFKRKSN